jgi:hypothetical protein
MTNKLPASNLTICNKALHNYNYDTLFDFCQELSLNNF